MKENTSMKEQLSKISVEMFGEDCTNRREAIVHHEKKEKVVYKQEDKGLDKKKKYPILFTGEDYCTTYVEMSRREALIVDRVLKEAVAQVKGYCGRVYLELDAEGISEKEPSVKRVTDSELLDLPFGTKIKVIWHNSKRHEKNEEYVGVVFGRKIGWEDGLEDDLRTIAECAYNDWCMVYIMED